MAIREVYKAIVSRNNDPQRLGRIRVTCQALAEYNAELPYWIEPIPHSTSRGGFGWFSVPETGSEVEIEVVTSDTSDETFHESFVTNPDAHYRSAPFDATTVNPVPKEFKDNYPHRHGVKTPGGHTLVFDASAGTVTIAASDGSISITLKGQQNQITIGSPAANEPVPCGNILVQMIRDMVNGALWSPAGPCFIMDPTWTIKYLDNSDTNILSKKVFTEK